MIKPQHIQNECRGFLRSRIYTSYMLNQMQSPRQQVLGHVSKSHCLINIKINQDDMLKFEYTQKNLSCVCKYLSV